MYQTPEDRPIYRLLTGKDDRAFCERVSEALEQGWRLAGVPLLPGVQRAGLFAGRLYLEAAIMQWEAWDGVGLLPERFNALMGGHQPVIATTPPGWRQRLQRVGRTFNYLRRAPALGRRGDAEVVAAAYEQAWCRFQPLLAELCARYDRSIRFWNTTDLLRDGRPAATLQHDFHLLAGEPVFPHPPIP